MWDFDKDFKGVELIKWGFWSRGSAKFEVRGSIDDITPILKELRSEEEVYV